MYCNLNKGTHGFGYSLRKALETLCGTNYAWFWFFDESMAHLWMSITDTCLLWSQSGGAHNTKVSIVTAMSAVIRSKGSLLRSRDTTLLTPTGALTKT